MPASDPLETYVSTKQAATFLGLSERTLEGLRLHGGGPAFCVLGRRAVRYSTAELQRWAKAGERSSTPELSAEGTEQWVTATSSPKWVVVRHSSGCWISPEPTWTRATFLTRSAFK